jgi:putative DNA primase/helicase
MTEFDPNFDPERIRAHQDRAKEILAGWEAKDAAKGAKVLKYYPRAVNVGDDPDQKAPESATLITRKASSYGMAALDWLWPERFAIGKLGLIRGLPDRGKGLISADLIACATNNHLLPCNEGRVPQGRVLYFTAEDDPEDTVVPRLVAAGADLDRVEIVGMVKEPASNKPRTFNLTTDLDLLRAKLEELEDVVLVIIDPISAYLGIGKVNAHSNTDIRGFPMPLKDLAKEKSVSMLGIMHFNKKTDVHDAMLRIADSLAYAATARQRTGCERVEHVEHLLEKSRA